ncbi:MAG TPA: hypothetical protein PLV92_13155, partial [Pirellulaceae bacterium]|nr:hypothetical protein [Pirellulaceae bacterium]
TGDLTLFMGANDDIEVSLSPGGNLRFQSDTDRGIGLSGDAGAFFTLSDIFGTASNETATSILESGPSGYGHLTIVGASSYDDVAFDYFFGSPLATSPSTSDFSPFGDVYVDAAAGKGSFKVVNGDFDSIDMDQWDAMNGAVDLTIGANTDHIVYDNQQWVIFDPNSVADLSIQLPRSSKNSDVTLGDDLGGDFGDNELRGSSVTWTKFWNPDNSLTVFAGDHGDTISVGAMDPDFNPGATTGAFQVFGGAGHDEVSVVSTEFSSQGLEVWPTGPGSAMVNGNNADPLTLLGVDGLNLVGQSSDLDTFAVFGTTTNDTFNYVPGATSGSATVTATLADGLFQLIPLKVEGMNVGQTYIFNDGPAAGVVPGFPLGTLGGTDTFLISGTSGLDIVSVNDFAATGANLQMTSDGLPSANISARNLSNGGNRGSVGIKTGDGLDVVTLNSPMGVNVAVDMGAPEAGDILSLTMLGSSQIGLDLVSDFNVITDSGTGSTVIFSNTSDVLLNANGQATTVLGLVSDLNLSVLPVGVVQAQAAGGLATVSIVNTTAIAVGTALPLGKVTISGSDINETYDVTGPVVSVNGSIPITVASAASFTVEGKSGDDTFNVTPGAIPVMIDGGGPIGVVGDTLNLVTGGAPVIYGAGPETDEGGFQLGVPGTPISAPVSFDHIEFIAPISTPSLAVTGSSASDDASVVQTGDQDFTLTTSGGPVLNFVNTPIINLATGAGDDKVQVQTNSALGAWNVTIALDAGLPTASDTLVIGTAGTDNVTYQPSTANSGTIAVTNLALVVNATNVEHVIYDGQDGGDTLTINGRPVADDVFTHTPGDTSDSGTVAVNSLLPLVYKNVGADAILTLVGSGALGDQLVVNGTSADDIFLSWFDGANNRVDLTTNGGTTAHTPIL